MASKFKPGDRVRTKDSWSGRTHGTGTVETTSSGGYGVALDQGSEGKAAHFYESELTKTTKGR